MGGPAPCPEVCPSPDPELTGATLEIIISNILTFPRQPPSSGATGGATQTITGRNISHRRITHSKPSSSGMTDTRVTGSTTGTTTTWDPKSQLMLLQLQPMPLPQGPHTRAPASRRQLTSASL